MKPHKHAELIKAWADGAEIELFIGVEKGWGDCKNPNWHEDWEYRIKPELKPDVVLYLYIGNPQPHIEGLYAFSTNAYSYDGYDDANIKITFDGETGELKSAEVLK